MRKNTLSWLAAGTIFLLILGTFFNPTFLVLLLLIFLYALWELWDDYMETQRLHQQKKEDPMIFDPNYHILIL